MMRDHNRSEGECQDRVEEISRIVKVARFKTVERILKLTDWAKRRPHTEKTLRPGLLSPLERLSHAEMQQDARDMAAMLSISTHRHLFSPTLETEVELRELTAYVAQERERFIQACLDGRHSALLVKAIADAKAALRKVAGCPEGAEAPRE